MGITPEPSKIVLIVHPDNLKSGKMFGLSHGFKVRTCARYLGGFIRDSDSKRDWSKESTQTWERNIHNISETAGEMSPGTLRRGGTCDPIGVDIFYNALQIIQETRSRERRRCFGKPFSFSSESQNLSPPLIGTLSTVPVKKSGPGLLNPMTSANE